MQRTLYIVAAVLVGAAPAHSFTASSACAHCTARVIPTPSHARTPAACRGDAVAMKSSGSNELDSWRITAARLEEGYRKDLLRRPRRFLPFPEARKWARAMWFTSREDWMGMINRGEKRNPYLPRRPDEYYEGKGWISWDDFLNDPDDRKP